MDEREEERGKRQRNVRKRNAAKTMDALNDLLETEDEFQYQGESEPDTFDLEEGVMSGSLMLPDRGGTYHSFFYDVYPDRQRVCFQVNWSSPLPERPVGVPLSEIAAAVCAANRRLPNGAFTFRKATGCIIFLIENSCAGGPVSEEALQIMLDLTKEEAFDIGNRLEKLADGEITLEDFLNELETRPPAAKPDHSHSEEQADNVYRLLCDFLETAPHGLFRYCTMGMETRTAHIWPSGTDCPARIDLCVDEEYRQIRLTSTLPVSIPLERRAAGAAAVCNENYSLPLGRFDYDVSTGTVTFRLCETIAGPVPGKELFSYMISRSVHVLDVYYHKFEMLARGELSPDQL